ncbi:MAG: 3-deoxy-7-phosphoheptulonate synthase [Oligoflexia bacterium]|nr:3-deoxy-7-phosphoheptulonate synthase [Oligoflexia bacterium]
MNSLRARDKAGDFRLVSRANHPDDTIVRVGSLSIGGPNFTVIAGPCSVESHSQITLCAAKVRSAGGNMLRGGCFKARTSPYAFQGLGLEGLKYLHAAGQHEGLPIITEVLSHDLVEEVSQYSDVLQIGARNMQNYPLLNAVGKSKRPVLLKRGMSASLDELLLAAEYILYQGNQQVILCERGIKTFETETRYTLDIAAIPALRLRTHLPVMVDPSHAAGRSDIVAPLALAAKAAGAHGIMVEIHPDPASALSDGYQAMTFGQFEELMANPWMQPAESRSFKQAANS